MNCVYTIGHSNHSPQKFLSLLAGAKIELVVDVRSYPGSSWVSHVNPRDLERILQSASIRYLYMGDMLRGRPHDPEDYDPRAGKLNYEAIQNTEPFQQGLSQLLESLNSYRVCVMCAEEDPASCHRNLLVGEALRHQGIEVLHIRGNGQIQTDAELWKERAGVAPNQLPLLLGDT